MTPTLHFFIAHATRYPFFYEQFSPSPLFYYIGDFLEPTTGILFIFLLHTYFFLGGISYFLDLNNDDTKELVSTELFCTLYI